VKRRRGGLAVSFLLLALLRTGAGLPPAEGQDAVPRERAEALAEEARQYRDTGAVSRAVEALRKALELDPRAETYRELGDLYAEQDRHLEAVAAYRAAVAADPSLEPELKKPIGEQLLWAERPGEAIPLLAAVSVNRPHDLEAKGLLALAYRWDDRLAEAERLYREILAGNPGDPEARKGLAESLLWQGRFRSATEEYLRALEDRPADPEALTGISRARLFLDLPEEAQEFLARVPRDSRSAPEVRDQAARVRERLLRFAEFGIRGSRDSDDLSIRELSLSVRARPSRGLDLEGTVRQRFFRQGSPGKENNLDAEDSVDGTGGSLSARYRRSPRVEWRAGVSVDRYDAAGFSPWGGSVGGTFAPRDTLRFDLDWERSHWDSILSLQNRVVIDTVGLGVARHFAWKTEVSASVEFLRHQNENDTGQDRENRGEQFSAAISRRLYLSGDVARVTGILRLGWLGFSRDLDVGVFDPERYTTEEAGVDWEWRFRSLWMLRGTVMGGAQQEKGAKGGPTYSAEVGLDRKVGMGLVSVEGFSFDSNARGQGEGFRRFGGLFRIRVPF